MRLPEGLPSASTCKHLAGRHLDKTGNYILRKTIINAITTDRRSETDSIACPTSEFGQFLAMDYQVGGTAAGGKFKLGERWDGAEGGGEAGMTGRQDAGGVTFTTN